MQTNIDFSQHVKEVLNRNNIQIRSLEFVDSKIKEQFFTQRKKAILLIRNKVYEREITALNDRTLDIFDTQLIPYLKKGQSILVVLPTGGKKRYVLQTKIVNIFIDRFHLTVLDPRNAKRFSFSPPIGAKIRSVCDATAIRIQTGEVRVIRYIDETLLDGPLDVANKTGSSPDEGLEKNVPASAIVEAPGAPSCQDPHFSIKDILLKDEESDQADDLIRLEGQNSIDGTILDISYGGMCVLYQPGAGKSFFVDQLLATECSFANGSQSQAGSERLNLFVFAVVRSTKDNQGANQLNLQFLANLPKTIQNYWQLES